MMMSHEGETEEGRQRSASVLVVDNDRDLREVVEGLLQDEGFAVVGCENGRNALSYLAQSRPSLVLLDVMMPYVNGYDVLAGMRADPALQDVPVILMSGASIDPDWRVRCAATLRKPFHADKLLATVGAAVGA